MLMRGELAAQDGKVASRSSLGSSAALRGFEESAYFNAMRQRVRQRDLRCQSPEIQLCPMPRIARRWKALPLSHYSGWLQIEVLGDFIGIAVETNDPQLDPDPVKLIALHEITRSYRLVPKTETVRMHSRFETRR